MQNSLDLRKEKYKVEKGEKYWRKNCMIKKLNLKNGRWQMRKFADVLEATIMLLIMNITLRLV